MKARATALMLLMILAAACQSSTPTASKGPSFVGASLPRCADDSFWRCGTIAVPLDRAHASGATIQIAYYVHDRIDITHPALEPVFTTPGGPGGSIWSQRNDMVRRTWQNRHDTVLVERRGVGSSGGIRCSGLQNGAATTADVWSATSACAAQLGDAADRYGTGDVALDIEAVRRALNVESFDFYAASYASVAAQAYVVRFPTRVHALVLDSGFAVVDAQRELYGTPFVAPTLRVLETLCSRATDCAKAYPHPDQIVERAIGQLEGHPIAIPGHSRVGALDAWALTNDLGPTGFGLPPKDYLDALAAMLSGHPDVLESLVAANQFPVLAKTDPNEFDNGDNVASLCTDSAAWLPWAAGDSFTTRQGKLDAAFKAIDPSAYAPLGLADVEAGAGVVEQCLAWPSPTRIEPVVPGNAPYPNRIPVLLLSGDVDLNAPTEVSRLLVQEFPQATFVVVAGAGHISSDPGWGFCGDGVVTTFFETLRADQGACATAAG